MGTHLHGRHLGRNRRGSLGELRLQSVGKGRGVGGGDAVARPAVHQRAEQAHGLAALRSGQMLDQMGGGGFAIGAGHTNEMPCAMRGAARTPQPSHRPMGHRLLDHHHRVITGGWMGCSGFGSDHAAAAPASTPLGPRTASIHPFPGKTEKQVPGPTLRESVVIASNPRVHQPSGTASAASLKGHATPASPSPHEWGLLSRSERWWTDSVATNSTVPHPLNAARPGEAQSIEMQNRHLEVVASVQVWVDTRAHRYQSP